MSRFLTHNFKTDEYLEEIESDEVCRWRINGVCCNDSCTKLGEYPYPNEMCHKDAPKYMKCEYYKDEDGVINGEN